MRPRWSVFVVVCLTGLGVLIGCGQFQTEPSANDSGALADAPSGDASVPADDGAIPSDAASHTEGGASSDAGGKTDGASCSQEGTACADTEQCCAPRTVQAGGYLYLCRPDKKCGVCGELGTGCETSKNPQTQCCNPGAVCQGTTPRCCLPPTASCDEANDCCSKSCVSSKCI